MKRCVKLGGSSWPFKDPFFAVWTQHTGWPGLRKKTMMLSLDWHCIQKNIGKQWGSCHLFQLSLRHMGMKPVAMTPNCFWWVETYDIFFMVWNWHHTNPHNDIPMSAIEHKWASSQENKPKDDDDVWLFPSGFCFKYKFPFLWSIHFGVSHNLVTNLVGPLRPQTHEKQKWPSSDFKENKEWNWLKSILKPQTYEPNTQDRFVWEKKLS